MTGLISGLGFTISLFLCADANFLGAVIPFSYPFYQNRIIQIDSPVLKSPQDFEDVEDKKESNGHLAEKQIGACNHLENLINEERIKYGYPPLKCDLNMGWVANQHITNQLENGFTGFEDIGACNLHSWFGPKYGCCYTSDHKNPQCIWNKPYELSGWDKRQGYEISAASTGLIQPEEALELWRASPGHWGLIIPASGTWANLKTVGCGWGKSLAHCWFATKEP